MRRESLLLSSLFLKSRVTNLRLFSLSFFFLFFFLLFIFWLRTLFQTRKTARKKKKVNEVYRQKIVLYSNCVYAPLTRKFACKFDTNFLFSSVYYHWKQIVTDTWAFCRNLNRSSTFVMKLISLSKQTTHFFSTKSMHFSLIIVLCEFTLKYFYFSNRNLYNARIYAG